MIQAFRGAAKTWLTGAYAAWRLLWSPEIKIMLVSASQGHADGLSLFIKGMFEEISILQHLAEGRRWRNDKFDVAGIAFDPSPSIKSIGLKGQLTGSRADIIIPDDIEVPANALTQHMREDTRLRTKEFRSVLKPEGQIKWLGTPQVEESLYNELPELGYDVKIWPARVPERAEDYEKNFAILDQFGNVVRKEQKTALAPMILRMMEDGTYGTPVEPSRFDEKDLKGRELEYGRAGFNLQFMLNTQAASSELHPLKLSDLIVDHLDHEMAHVKYVWGNSKDNGVEDSPLGFEGDRCYFPVWRSSEMAPYTQTVLAIDPSGGGADETGYAVVKSLHGNLFLMESGGYLEGYSDATLKGLAERAAFWGVTDIIVEKNFGGGMFGNLLRPKLLEVNAHCEIHDPVSGNIMKEYRICDTLEPLIMAHRLIVNRSVLTNDVAEARQKGTTKYSLIYQLTRMMRAKGALAHEDRLEAVQMGCAFFEDRMVINTNKAISRHKDKAIAKLVKEWNKDIPGQAITLGRKHKKRQSNKIWRNKPKVAL
jgi:hypothetical protein